MTKEYKPFTEHEVKMNEVFERVTKLVDEHKISQEKHTEICKEALYNLWIKDRTFDEEVELEIELEIERCIKAEVNNE